MKRLYLAAVAGLLAATPVSAQQGYLAPTAPVVPAPVLQNGNLLAPSGGSGAWGAPSGPRLLAVSKWSPFRNPATANMTEPMVSSAASYGHAMPPLPAGVGGADGLCGSAGCTTKRDRSCLDRVKAWLCYQPSKSELPILRPTPYVPPLLGMYPCVSANCGAGCGNGNGIPAAVQPPTMTPPGQLMPPPIPQAGAGAVMMPPRGTQSNALTPIGHGRTAPAPGAPGVAGYRFATPESKSGPGPVVNASLKMPAPK